MKDPICIWLDGCDKAPRAKSGGLCNTHIQQARKAASTNFYASLLRSSRTCAHCGGPIVRPRANAVYCSKSCYNGWYRANGKSRPTIEFQREYGARARAKAREGELASRGVRLCVECDSEFPVDSRSHRRFCSRACINKVRLREKPDQARMHARKYRAGKRGTSSCLVTERDWRRLMCRFRGCCAYCGAAGDMTADHVIPLSRGGRHAIGNLLPACRSCNNYKRARLLAQVRYREGRFLAL